MATAKAEAEKLSTNALATVATGNAISAEMAAELAEDAGAGTSQSADDNIIPFIVLLQDMSPEVKKRDPEYVEGAEVGMLLNKATRQLYASDAKQAEETGLPLLAFQPVAFDRAVIEWVPRNAGGGFVARHEIRGTIDNTYQAIGAKQVPDAADPNRMVWKSADGKNDIVDTRYHYGNCIGADGMISPAVISMSSTGHTASREWMTLMNNFKVRAPNGSLVVAPSWSKWYTVRSKGKTNTKGDFFVFTVEDGGIITDRAIRDAGKQLNIAFSSGKVRTEDSAAASAASGAEDSAI